MIWAIAPTPITPARNRSIAKLSLSLTSDHSAARSNSFLFCRDWDSRGENRDVVALSNGNGPSQLKDRTDLAHEATVVIAQLGRVAFQDGLTSGRIEDAELLQGSDGHGGGGGKAAIQDSDGNAQFPLRNGQADEALGPALGHDAAIAERHQVGDELTVPGDVLGVRGHRRSQPVKRGGVLAPHADRDPLRCGERGEGGREGAHRSPERGKAAAVGAEDDRLYGDSHDLRHDAENPLL